MMTAVTTRDIDLNLKARRDEIDLLIRKFLSQGEEQVFDLLFRKMYAPLCHFALKMVNEKTAAEEVVSDVFLKLWNHRDYIEINTSAKSYLYASVRNKSLDFLRKEKKKPIQHEISAAANCMDNCVSVLDSLALEDLNRKVQMTMCELPPKCQLIFRMSREEGLRYAEIADQLDLSVKTIETQMGRALKHMKEKLL
ncbi:MAG: RNA polymerase sigma-70 factor [Cyclobacteriaceae bacterium]